MTAVLFSKFCIFWAHLTETKCVPTGSQLIFSIAAEENVDEEEKAREIAGKTERNREFFIDFIYSLFRKC